MTDATGGYADPAAQKLLRLDHFDKYDRFKREVSVASSLSHPTLCRILDSHLPENPSEDDRPFLVMPWYGGGTLRDLLVRGGYTNQPQHALEVFLPILRAVQHLHSQGKFHRDIKPSNILFDGDRPVLCDFGLAFDLDDPERLTSTSEKIGSTGYRAPEYFEGRHEIQDHAPGDVFALGKTIWAMLAGEEPGDGGLQYPGRNLVGRFKNAEIRDAYWLTIWLTKEHPLDRPSVKEVVCEVERLLMPAADAEQLDDRVGAHAVRVFDRFMATDAAVQRRRDSRSEDERRGADILALLGDLFRRVRDDPAVKAVVERAPGRYPEDPSFYVGPAGGDSGFLPGEHAEVERELQMKPLSEGHGVSFVFSPGSILKEEHGTPMIICAWSLIPSGRRVRFASYVYTRDAPGHPNAYSKIDFVSSLDSPTLRRSILGSVPRQLEAFFERLRLEHAGEALETSGS